MRQAPTPAPHSTRAASRPWKSRASAKAAVEGAFSVKVKAVNTMNVKPKAKSRMIRRGSGRITGSGRGWKKAVVTLQPGERIDIFEQI